jgi:hypothetical protein
MEPWNVSQFLDRLPRKTRPPQLPPPHYVGDRSEGVMMAVESMKDHMTDEGWQIAAGLESTGYKLAGYHLPCGHVDAGEIIRALDPGVVLVQDKREWDPRPGNFREEKARFTNLESLRNRTDIFKLTVLKDSHQNPDYHRESAIEIGCHAWVIYYNPRIVKRLAPYVRPRHLIRTYHSLDQDLIPPFREIREDRALLSGALSAAYPLRTILVKDHRRLPGTQVLRHPGYHRGGCSTPQFLLKLNQFKVAICTSSRFGYSLRKIIEATACGCKVVTDLPTDEILPGIDGNLIRVSPVLSTLGVAAKIQEAYTKWNPEEQKEYARVAKDMYDYRAIGERLKTDIELLRREYP